MSDPGPDHEVVGLGGESQHGWEHLVTGACICLCSSCLGEGKCICPSCACREVPLDIAEFVELLEGSTLNSPAAQHIRRRPEPV